MSCPLVTATAEWYKSSDVTLIRPSIHTMPASDNSTQRTQALALLKRRGMTRLAEFGEAGITATTVGRMERAGEVVRLARGLYQLPDAALDTQQSLAEAARLVPKGVICLASALAFHGLTDQMPPRVWIAIGRKDWRPRLTYPPIRIARFSDELLRRSVERKKIAGTIVPVFIEPSGQQHRALQDEPLAVRRDAQPIQQALQRIAREQQFHGLPARMREVEQALAH